MLARLVRSRPISSISLLRLRAFLEDPVLPGLLAVQSVYGGDGDVPDPGSDGCEYALHGYGSSMSMFRFLLMLTGWRRPWERRCDGSS